jgi:hypothetical protein
MWSQTAVGQTPRIHSADHVERTLTGPANSPEGRARELRRTGMLEHGGPSAYMA